MVTPRGAGQPVAAVVYAYRLESGNGKVLVLRSGRRTLTLLLGVWTVVRGSGLWMAGLALSSLD